MFQSVSVIVLCGYVLLSLLLIPMQYLYIKELRKLEEERVQQGITQNELYDRMPFERQQLHYNAQGNPLFILANLFATVLYKIKNRK